VKVALRPLCPTYAPRGRYAIPHIGDRLDAKKLSWAWYRVVGTTPWQADRIPSFYFICQPFAYFANLADGTAAKAQHLRDESDFFAALQGGGSPSVAFVKPLSPDTQHPGEADITRGDQCVAPLIQAVQNSPYWVYSAAIIVTYDEHGGFRDRVPPPKVDRWGPGIRVPAIIISPFAKEGFVDKTVYDTTSILSFIEWRWSLEPLGLARQAPTP